MASMTVLPVTKILPCTASRSRLARLEAVGAKWYSAIRPTRERFISSGKYELLMEAKEDGQTMRMYTVGSDKVVNGFVMLAAEADEVTFICLDGQMPRDQFEQLLAKQMED